MPGGATPPADSTPRRFDTSKEASDYRQDQLRERRDSAGAAVAADDAGQHTLIRGLHQLVDRPCGDDAIAALAASAYRQVAAGQFGAKTR